MRATSRQPWLSALGDLPASPGGTLGMPRCEKTEPRVLEVPGGHRRDYRREDSAWREPQCSIRESTDHGMPGRK